MIVCHIFSKILVFQQWTERKIFCPPRWWHRVSAVLRLDADNTIFTWISNDVFPSLSCSSATATAIFSQKWMFEGWTQYSCSSAGTVLYVSRTDGVAIPRCPVHNSWAYRGIFPYLRSQLTLLPAIFPRTYFFSAMNLTQWLRPPRGVVTVSRSVALPRRPFKISLGK